MSVFLAVSLSPYETLNSRWLEAVLYFGVDDILLLFIKSFSTDEHGEHFEDH